MYHPKHSLEDIRSRQPDHYFIFYALVPKEAHSKVKMIMLADSSTPEELNRSGTLLVNPITANPTVG